MKFFAPSIFWHGTCWVLLGSGLPLGLRAQSPSTPPAPDYAQATSWAALPDRADAADAVPPGLRDGQAEARVDVFFVHPTTYTRKRQPEEPWNADVADAKLNATTDESTIRYQASIFNSVGRVYAPRYRQAHLSAYFTADPAVAKAAFDVAYADVRAAFEYYLEHYNQGRPIIIAAHSQGTTHCKRLVREFFDGTARQGQLVAAYLVGIPVEKDWFAQLPLCPTATATGCYCAWRTYLEEHYPPGHQKANNIAVTNPLNWSIEPVMADRTLNQGAVLRKFTKVLPEVCGARIEDGLLWVTKPKFPGSFLYRNPNYHIADYNLFYLNVRTNAEQRVEAFGQGVGK